MPDTGGANIPALNDMLSEFGIAFGDAVSEGYFAMGDHSMYYASGTSLIRFPQVNGSILIERDLHDQGLEVKWRRLYINGLLESKFVFFLFCFIRFCMAKRSKPNIPYRYWACCRQTNR